MSVIIGPTCTLLLIISCMWCFVVVIECSRPKKHHNCSLQESTTDLDAGEAQNVRAVCKFQEETNSFYYQFTWDKPKLGNNMAVSVYRLLVLRFATQFCFQLPAKKRTFNFNISGVAPTSKTYYAVTPQPILHIDGRYSIALKRTPTCPVWPVLLDLPNRTIHVGENFSFHCGTEQAATKSSEDVRWYFSADTKNCSERVILTSSRGHVRFSEDRRTLRINNATRQHQGCYILMLMNAKTHVQERVGFVQVTVPRKKAKKRHWKSTEILGLVIGGTLVSGAVLAVARYHFIRYLNPYNLFTKQEHDA